MIDKISRNSVKIILRESSVSRGDTLSGCIRIKYSENMLRQGFKFKLSSVIETENMDDIIDQALMLPTKKFIERDRVQHDRQRVELKGKAQENDRPRLNQVYERMSFQRFDRVYKYHAQKLSRVGFLSKKKTQSDSDRDVECHSLDHIASPFSMEIPLFECEHSLNQLLQKILTTHSEEYIQINFEIALNNKLCTSVFRVIETVPRLHAPCEQMEELQELSISRAKTITSRKLHSEEPERDSNIAKVQVITRVQVLMGGKVVASEELQIGDSSDLLKNNVDIKVAGEVERVKFKLLCCKLASKFQYSIRFHDYRISVSKPAILFTMRLQNGVVQKYQYIEFRLKEYVLKNKVRCLSNFVFGFSFFLLKTRNSKTEHRLPHEFFEIVGKVSFKELNIPDYYSIRSEPFEIKHKLKVYLSQAPLGFDRLIGDLDVEIQKLTSEKLLPEDYSPPETSKKQSCFTISL